VDQPHEDDREEVELLAQDHAVERLALRARGFLQVLDLSEHEIDHLPLHAGRSSATVSPLGGIGNVQLPQASR
jgi:hypothetical protein